MSNQEPRFQVGKGDVMTGKIRTYVCIVKYWPFGGERKDAKVTTSDVGTYNIADAIRMATDDEGGDWEWKRCYKEVVSVTLVE